MPVADERDSKSGFRWLRGDAAPIDGKFISDRIKMLVRPRLRQLGFESFAARRAWRHGNATIDVVNFRSLSAYNADAMGCTTLSFQLELGCYVRAVPSHPITGHVLPDTKRPKPTELVCPFRFALERGFGQPECDAIGIWYVDPKARNLDIALADALAQIERFGLPVLESLQDPVEALRVLEHEDEVMRGGLWGFGNHGSSVRNWNIGHMAQAANRPDVAERAFAALLATDGSDEGRRPLIEAALERARSNRREKR
jgi:hypothetical protein